MAVKIVSDSTCDIARETVARLDIAIVPAYVLFGEEQFRQGIDINPTQFYTRLQSSPRMPSTSQPTPRDFTERMEPLVSAGHQVVCITVPQQLSGTYNSATQAAIAVRRRRGERGTARRNVASVSAGRRHAWRPSERVSVNSTPRSSARRPRPRSKPLTA